MLTAQDKVRTDAAIDAIEKAKPGEITHADRLSRRKAVRKKRGCARCNLRFTSSLDLVWDDGKLAHKNCAEKHNDAVTHAKELAQRARVEQLGLRLPDSSPGLGARS